MTLTLTGRECSVLHDAVLSAIDGMTHLGYGGYDGTESPYLDALEALEVRLRGEPDRPSRTSVPVAS